MFELKYVIPEDEIGEVTIRAYFRGDTVERDQLRAGIWGGVWGVVALFIIAAAFANDWPDLWVWVIAFGGAAFLSYRSHHENAAKRILRYVRSNRKNTGPMEVQLRIDEGEIHAKVDGEEKVFRTEDIVWAGNDDHYFEARLVGEVHIAMPLRVFESTEQMMAFLEALGVHDLRDLAQHASQSALPKKQQVKGAIRLVLLPLYVLSIASTLMGIMALWLSIHAAGIDGLDSPLAYIAMGMILCGALLGAVLMICKKRAALR